MKTEKINWEGMDTSTASVSAIGFDEDGREVAIKFHCAKEECNCVGHWVNGNAKEVFEWVDRK